MFVNTGGKPPKIIVNLKHRVIIGAAKYMKIIITADFIEFFEYNSVNYFHTFHAHV